MDTATLQIILRWIHLVAGITWIGLLFFFNLVNAPFLNELAPEVRSKVFSPLMSRALWWFRWSSVVTVVAGIWYWMMIVGADARNARMLSTSAEQAAAVKSGWTVGSFFLFWTLAWLLTFLVVVMAKQDKPAVVGLAYLIAIAGAAVLYIRTNEHGWESNRLLCIGVGGGIGWLMMLNVWGVIWRFNKAIIRYTKDSVANGTPMPAKGAIFARMVFVTSRANFAAAFVMLFFMAAASHYALFGQ
jgi:uncharacterized membrane protein